MIKKFMFMIGCLAMTMGFAFAGDENSTGADRYFEDDVYLTPSESTKLDSSNNYFVKYAKNNTFTWIYYEWDFETGESQQFEEQKNYEYDKYWESSNYEIVSTESDGTIKALKPGNVIVIDPVVKSSSFNNENCIGAAIWNVHVEFEDVRKSNKKYYYDPVYWAVENNITNGFKDDDGYFSTFGPEQNCTREQMVTFLWRMAGEPEPETSSSSFEDVKKGKYYYKAVLWAAEKGITKGYDDGTFGVGKTVNRADTVTFLYRFAGKPKVNKTATKFSDVEAGKYYANPIAWASSNSITKGYDDGTFKVSDNCLREHIVTFLFRYAKLNGVTYKNEAGFWEYQSGEYKKQVFDYDFESMTGSWVETDETANYDYLHYAIKDSYGWILEEYYIGIVPEWYELEKIQPDSYRKGLEISFKTVYEYSYEMGHGDYNDPDNWGPGCFEWWGIGAEGELDDKTIILAVRHAAYELDDLDYFMKNEAFAISLEKDIFYSLVIYGER